MLAQLVRAVMTGPMKKPPDLEGLLERHPNFVSRAEKHKRFQENLAAAIAKKQQKGNG